MEILLWIIAALFVTSGAYITGYVLGKQNLRQDYKDHYKEVQLERDKYKALLPDYLKLTKIKEEKEQLVCCGGCGNMVSQKDWLGVCSKCRGDKNKKQETQELLKKSYEILSPIGNQWEGRETVPGQFFLASLRSAVIPSPEEEFIAPIPKNMDKISEYYEKVLQTDSECEHDWMGTLSMDVKICRKCSTKKRRKSGNIYEDKWIEDK